jgi:hypothetical protein
MARSTNGTNRARERFIDELRASCNVSAAARAAGIPRRTAYNWRASDPAFAEAWEDAEEEAADDLEQVARDRAKAGSERMLEILLKAHRPEKFVERVRSELSGPGGSPLQVTTIERRIVDPRD